MIFWKIEKSHRCNSYSNKFHCFILSKKMGIVKCRTYGKKARGPSPFISLLNYRLQPKFWVEIEDVDQIRVSNQGSLFNCSPYSFEMIKVRKQTFFCNCQNAKVAHSNTKDLLVLGLLRYRKICYKPFKVNNDRLITLLDLVVGFYIQR